VVSPNLLEPLARRGDRVLRFHHAGEAKLKGVLQGEPFPLWIISADGLSTRPATPGAEVEKALADFRRRLAATRGIECAPPLFAAR
jgi:hypothetical protein